METINVVIDEASTSESSKDVDQLSKSILLLTLEVDQEVDDQDPPFPASPCAT